MKRRQTSARLFGVAFAACVILAQPFAARAQNLEASGRLAARVDQWIKPYERAGDFSGAVLIAQGDRILVEKTYGSADFLHKVPNRAETRFRVASLSKTFTAAAIELLLQEKRVGLNDSLGQYVSGIANGEKITIEQLLSHESGVGTVDNPDSYRDCLSTADFLERLRKAKQFFSPGTGSQYSNEGYFLLALVIEKVSGTSYESFLQENIFGRLGMKNTGSACRDLPPGANAIGNVPGAANGGVIPLPFNEAAEIGPGSIYSNVGDLLVWLKAVDTNPLFRNRALKYPYGWGRRNYSGHRLIEQSGILEGFNAHVALYAEEHIYAVILSNIQSGLFNRIPKDLEAVLFGGETSTPPAVKGIKVTPLKLEEYAGEYTSKAISYHQTLLVQDGRLCMRWGTFPFLRALIPTGTDQFFLRYEYADVRFERDGSSKVVRMTWKWPEGEPMEFQKLEKSP
jgi:CubicO group peptidase (beta-lactamase class C family)